MKRPTNPTLSAIQPPREARCWTARLARSNAFAWTFSIGAHLGVFAVLYPMVLSEEMQPRRVIIPEARLAPMVEAPAEQPPTAVRIDHPQDPTPQAAPDETLIAVEPLPASVIDEHVLPAPQLPAKGASALAGAGSPAVAGPPGPVSTFFGVAGNAYRVVYVVDMSASLDIYVDDIMNEMRRSIQALVATQQFNIAVTHSETVEQFRRGSLAWANARNKLQGAEFIVAKMRTAIRGKALPNEAMKEAFAAQPELIYFLSDGDYEDVQDAVLNNRRTSLENTLDQLNRDRSVKITVIFFGEGPRQRTILERIAREHGGNFRTVVLK